LALYTRDLASGAFIEQLLGGLASDDPFGHGVGVSFVCVASLANSIAHRDRTALLDHVRGFVRRLVKVGGASERDVLARRVGVSADRVGSVGGGAANVRLNAG
jgi:hypothetical protein